MGPSHPSPRRVALLIEASRAYARGLVRGVAQYNREHREWSVTFTPRGLDDPPPVWLRDWSGDGILARIEDRRTARAVAAKGVPVVEMRRAIRGLGFPSIGPDDEAVARLVLEHFLGRGFRHFAFVGVPRGSHPSMDARAEHFVRLVTEAGLACDRFHLFPLGRRDGEKRPRRSVLPWLRTLPKPTALMACSDDVGLTVLNACQRAGILVPDEIAVAGVGNDDCLCSLAVPPLTSVDLNPQRIGYEAAALLDTMMAGKHPAAAEIVVPPSGIVTRLSTDVLATDDQCVVLAVRFIRAHAAETIRVRDVLRHAHLSRAALEPRIKRVLGRTIHQEIQRIRIERVKELLVTSDAPLKWIAAATGFRYPEYMMRVFRRATGRTPNQFRKQARRITP